MNPNIEKDLMNALRYGGGMSKEDLSELVRLGSKLVEQMSVPKAGMTRAPIWWKYGTPAILGIAFETQMDEKGLQTLVDVINKNPEIRSAIRLELTPGTSASGPDPLPWKVVGKIGGNVAP